MWLSPLLALALAEGLRAIHRTGAAPGWLLVAVAGVVCAAAFAWALAWVAALLVERGKGGEL
jgi:high-affinity Fe2+/Pb2+ permease